MAPNSNFNYAVNWENQAFKSGRYRAKVTTHSVDHDKTWTWDEEFTITNDEAKKLNEEAVELEKGLTPWWVYVVITLGIILLLLLIFYLIKKYRDKQRTQNEKKRKKTNRSKVSSKSESSSKRNGKKRK